MSIEVALANVEAIHHIHGQECLCGFASASSRARTKHIMEVTLAAVEKAAARGVITMMTMDEDLGALPNAHVLGIRLQNGHRLRIDDMLTVVPWGSLGNA